jgi:hypothetical protein
MSRAASLIVVGMIGLVGLLEVSGCAHQDPEARAAEQRRQQRCASIEVYPLGVAPPRPYRILGPVSVSSDGIPAHRDRTLQDRACALGADAIMDVSEHALLDNSEAGANMQAGGSIEAAGTAVAYTDGSAAATAAP